MPDPRRCPLVETSWSFIVGIERIMEGSWGSLNPNRVNCLDFTDLDLVEGLCSFSHEA